MKLAKKDFFNLIIICGIVSALIYYFTGNVAATISIWAIYGLSLFSGSIFHFILSKFISHLHVEVLVSWLIFLIISASIAALDFYLVTPLFREALGFPLPLSFSPLVWVAYAFILAIFTCNHYTSNRSCLDCRGITPRDGNYCARCGISLQVEKEEMSDPVVES